MPQLIQLKRSTTGGTVPSTGAVGEMQVNLIDRKIYSNNGSSIVPINGVTATNTQLVFSDSGYANGSAGLTFNKTTNTLTIANTLSVTRILANGSTGTSQTLMANSTGGVYWGTAGVGATRTYSSTTASVSQNVFTISGYSTGYIDVYYDGVHLTTSEFAEVNSTAIQLGFNAVAGAVVELVGLTGVDVLTVGGSDGQVTFNDGGFSNGSAHFTFNKTTKTTTLGNTADTFVTYTSTTLSAETIDSFALATWRAAKYFVTLKDNNANNKQVCELIVLNDDTNVSLSEFGTLTSNTNLGSFTATSNATHGLIQFTGTSNSILFMVHRKLMSK